MFYSAAINHSANGGFQAGCATGSVSGQLQPNYSLPGKKLRFFKEGHAQNIQEFDFHRGKSPCGMRLAHLGLVSTRNSKKASEILGDMLEIFRNAVFTDENAPAGCSKLAKGL